MNDPGLTRVAVYIDFDNIVISRYDQVHGQGQFQRDKVRGFSRADGSADPSVADKLRRATVDVGTVIDFASSFGTLVLTRAYADWSDPVNADYRGQLVSRAVDLVQLFPAAAYAKNGADIRLAVDAVALEAALPAERLRHNIYPEMSFPALSMPGMPGVLVGFVDYLQVRRGESLRQLLGDDIACCHASRHSGSRTVRSIGENVQTPMCQDLKMASRRAHTDRS